MPTYHTLLHQLQEHRRTLRVLGKPVPLLKKPPVPHFPWGPERTYARQLTGMVAHLKKIAQQHLESRLPAIVTEAGFTHRAQDEWVDEATALSDAIYTQFGEDYTPDQITQMARDQGVDVANVNGRDLLRILAHVFSVDPLISEPWLASHIKSFTKQNVHLISSLPKRALGEMQNIILTNTRQGLRSEEMIPKIMDLMEVKVPAWARFLARDQTAKYNSDLTETRHREVGIDSYTWWTAMDERVRGRPGGLYPNARPSHWAKQGKIFSYARPPRDTGNPGQSYQCRCVAIPYFGAFENSLDGAQGFGLTIGHALHRF